MSVSIVQRAGLAAILVLSSPAIGRAAEPPAVDPFGARPAVREDAATGYVELSTGKIRCGAIYLTRDARLKIYDGELHRQREIPLSAVRRIDCEVKREWMEKEWRFKELASDEKMVTGRQYPAREYVHTITLRDGRKIKGPLSALVYLRAEKEEEKDARQTPAADPPRGEPQRFTLHKRDKGKVGTDLKSLVYVRCIRLGEEALEEGRQKAIKAKSLSRNQRSSPRVPGP